MEWARQAESIHFHNQCPPCQFLTHSLSDSDWFSKSTPPYSSLWDLKNTPYFHTNNSLNPKSHNILNYIKHVRSKLYDITRIPKIYITISCCRICFPWRKLQTKIPFELTWHLTISHVICLGTLLKSLKIDRHLRRQDTHTCRVKQIQYSHHRPLLHYQTAKCISLCNLSITSLVICCSRKGESDGLYGGIFWCRFRQIIWSSSNSIRTLSNNPPSLQVPGRPLFACRMTGQFTASLLSLFLVFCLFQFCFNFLVKIGEPIHGCRVTKLQDNKIIGRHSSVHITWRW